MDYRRDRLNEPDSSVPPHVGEGGRRAAIRSMTAGSGQSGTFRRCYDVQGFRVDVFADDPDVLGRVHAILDHLGILPATLGDTPAVVWLYSTQPGAVRLPRRARAIAEQDGIHAWSSNGALYLSCDGHVGRLDPAAGTAEVVVPTSPGGLRKDFITHGFLLLLRRRGLYPLHASGVSQAGAGCLFVAPSGGGKSTHTYSLVRTGWDYLG